MMTAEQEQILSEFMAGASHRHSPDPIQDVPFPERRPTPYKLALTASERSAFDWVGHRYSNGDAMQDILTDCEQTTEDGLPYEGEYNWPTDPKDPTIVYHLTESQAWAISELAEQDDNLWPCFADELAMKMTEFCNRIV